MINEQLYLSLQRENERLREILHFYAKESNYYEEIPDHVFRTTKIAEDNGNLARTILSNKELKK